MERYKKPIGGFNFGVLVKVSGEWRLVGMFITENKAVEEIARQLEILDMIIDLD